MQRLKDRIIVALDVSTLKEAKHFVDTLYPKVKLFKVGAQLFTSCGPAAVEMIAKKGAKVFLDLKFHDIPNTVFASTASGIALAYVALPATYSDIERKVREVTEAPVFMMTVHIKGGREMLESAVRGAKERAAALHIKKPFIVGVTRLTSDEDTAGTKRGVLEASRMAQSAGLDGVVCSAHEARLVRKECGKNFLVVTPGIRPAGAKNDDQRRTATASRAFAAGADFIVVGRPVLKAADPLRALKRLFPQK